MPKSLITGGAGFIGLHLARALHRRGHELVLVDNLARGRRDPDLEVFLDESGAQLLCLDLLRSGALDGVGEDFDYIFHLAALVGVRIVRSRPYEVLSWNTAMLESVLGLARRQRRLSRLLFSSTSEVYAGALEHLPIQIPTPEATPLVLPDPAEPRTSYMLSKICGEVLCRHSGLPWTIFRVHNAYGPRMGLSHVIPEILQRAFFAADGGTLEVSSIGHSRSFCFVEDVVELVSRMAELTSCRGQVLNAGAQEPEVTIGQLAGIILEVTGRRLEIVALPETPGSPRRRAPDMTKTTSLTGYAARVSLRDGVAWTFDWYKSRVFEGRQESAI
jgi:nucleoside-diphosphate-sugar epimerase